MPRSRPLGQLENLGHTPLLPQERTMMDEKEIDRMRNMQKRRTGENYTNRWMKKSKIYG
jgi:hypothetical protein